MLSETVQMRLAVINHKVEKYYQGNINETNGIQFAFLVQAVENIVKTRESGGNLHNESIRLVLDYLDKDSIIEAIEARAYAEKDIMLVDDVLAGITKFLFQKIKIFLSFLIKTDVESDIAINAICSSVADINEAYYAVMQLTDVVVRRLREVNRDDLKLDSTKNETIEIIVDREQLSFVDALEILECIQELYTLMAWLFGMEVEPLEIVKIESGSWKAKLAGSKKIIQNIKKSIICITKLKMGALEAEVEIKVAKEGLQVIEDIQEAIKKHKTMGNDTTAIEGEIGIALQKITNRVSRVYDIGRRNLELDGENIVQKIEMDEANKKLGSVEEPKRLLSNNSNELDISNDLIDSAGMN